MSRREPTITLGALRGHTIVLSLMKRSMLVRGTPEQVERLICGPPLEDLDKLGAVHVKACGFEHRERLAWSPEHRTRGRMGEMFEDLATRATGRAVSMMAASRSDLYRVAVFLCEEIDRHVPDDLHPHYPDGWREDYQTIRASMNPASAAAE